MANGTATASKKGFEGIIDSIKNTVTDVSSLEVMTFRGTITGNVNGEYEWKDLLTQLKADKGKLTLALATVVDLDSDTRTFIADEAPPQWIIDVHTAAVASGLEARRAILELVTNSVRSLVSPVSK
ncbi:MAG: hypothetical protein QM691_03050 [Opitutaceae bacterium]